MHWDVVLTLYSSSLLVNRTWQWKPIPWSCCTCCYNAISRLLLCVVHKAWPCLRQSMGKPGLTLCRFFTVSIWNVPEKTNATNLLHISTYKSPWTESIAMCQSRRQLSFVSWWLGSVRQGWLLVSATASCKIPCNRFPRGSARWAKQ